MKRIAKVVLLTGILVGIGVGVGPSADAAAPSLGVPTICSNPAPTPDAPDAGLPGVFMTAPKDPPAAGDSGADTPADPASLYTTSGMSGMAPITYDMGCGINVSSWGRHLNTWSDQQMAGRLSLIAQAETSAADSISRFAFDGSWVTALFTSLAQQALPVITLRILVPFLGAGLIVVTISLLNDIRKGDTQRVAHGVTRALYVLILGAFVLAAPTLAPRAAGAAMGVGVQTLYGGTDPSSAVTNRTTQAVHYDAWLRRVFGSDDTQAAQTWGPRLLADTRLTYDQQARSDNPAVAKAILKAKSDDFKVVAKEVKAKDPDAYRHLTGTSADTTSSSWFEVWFSTATNLLRIFTGLLMVMCKILIGVFALCWLIGLPWLVTPRGAGAARTLLDSSARAVGFAVVATIGSWLYSIFGEAVLKPGWPAWICAVLMTLGTFMFWVAISPVRHMLSMMTLGRVRGHGRYVKRAYGAIPIAAVGGFLAGQAGAALREFDFHEQQVRDEEHHRRVVEPLERLRSGRDLPAPDPATGTPPYVRPGPERGIVQHPVFDAPPPDGAASEIYDRDAARQEEQSND
jgi:hypothetical protein